MAAHVDKCQRCRRLLELLKAEAAPTITHVEGGPQEGLASGEDGDDPAPDHTALAAVERSSYTFGQEIGRGGMGRILSARDLRIGRPVAVKELLSRTSNQALRFEREARVTAKLQHPNIVPIYEIGQWDDGTPFYSMRIVDGVTLREALISRTTLAERLTLLPSLIAAAEAIAFAHTNKIIHRDLTPSNIMVGEFGETVVIDWGLAKDLSTGNNDDVDAVPYRTPADPDRSGLTAVGTVLGTAAYMPPEQALAREVDERTDVYAFGAILYHVLAGFPPYSALDTTSVLELVKRGPPRPITEVAPGAPRDLLSIVNKAMARTASERYPSARQLSDELVRFQNGLLVEAHEYTRLELVRRWLARNRRVVIAIGAALIALAIVALVSFNRIIDERDRAEDQTGRATQANLQLLEEQGRRELLAGHPSVAAVWLSAAYRGGRDSKALRLILASALRNVEAAKHRLECGQPVWSVVPSPDNSHVAVVCGPSLKIWTITSGLLDVSIDLGGVDTFSAVRYSHDGRRLLGTSGNHVLVYDEHGKLVSKAIDPSGQISGATFSPDDKSIVTTSVDGSARLWNAETGARLSTLEMELPRSANEATVSAIFLDDTRVFALSRKGDGTIWTTSGDRQPGTLPIGPFETVHFSDDSRLAVTCHDDQSIRIWDLEHLQVTRSFTDTTGDILECWLSPRGDQLLTTHPDGHAAIWQTNDGIVSTIVGMSGERILHGAFSSDGRRLATVTSRATIRIWDTHTGGLLGTADSPGRLRPVFSADSVHLFAGGGDDGSIQVWKGLDGVLLRSFVPPPMTSIIHALDSDERVVTMHHGDRHSEHVIGLWNVTSNQQLLSYPLTVPVASARAAHVLAASSITNDMCLGSARKDDSCRREISVIDTETGITKERFPATDALRSLSFDGQGNRLLVYEEGAESHVWDVARHEELLTFGKDKHVGPLSDDGRFVVAWTPPTMSTWARDVGEGGLVVEIWDVNAKSVAVRFSTGYQVIDPIGFSKDDEVIALTLGLVRSDLTPNSQAPIGLWSTVTGKVIGTTPTVASAALSDDGTRLALFRVGTVDVMRMSDGATVTSAPVENLRVMRGDIVTDGSLLAAIDMERSSVDVIDTTDGRKLLSFPLERPSPKTMAVRVVTNGFGDVWGEPRFRLGGSAVGTVSSGLTLWSTRLETRSPDEVERIVTDNIRWRLVDGHIVRATGRCVGRVTRNGLPVAGARVTVTTREEDEESWESTTTYDGTFVVEHVPIGLVRLRASTAEAIAKPRTARIHEGDNASDLELDVDASIAGVVVDSKNARVAHAHVRFHRHAGKFDRNPRGLFYSTEKKFPDDAEAITGTDGTFVARPLRGNGDYDTLLDKDGRSLFPTVGEFPSVHLGDQRTHLDGLRLVVDRGLAP